jgi:tRNA G18 (ribose-2'-O)-methylase SpoU
VRWECAGDACSVIERLRAERYEIAAIETSVKSVDLFDWEPAFPVCLVFGNEIDGIRPEVSALADTYVRIPMLGMKYSLNVATAGGVVIYELLRKYRERIRSGAQSEGALTSRASRRGAMSR